MARTLKEEEGRVLSALTELLTAHVSPIMHNSHIQSHGKIIKGAEILIGH